MDRLIGKIVNHRYRIQGIVGMGGMAVVYRAVDIKTGNTVAVKVLKQELLGDEQFRSRFENESRAISILNHKNIVDVYDVALNEDLYYIVMEFLDGITLKQYIRQQERLGWRESLYFLGQVLGALQHAHAKGIVHRDIKPQNIMLLKDGSIKVTDFGIARFSTTNTNTMTDKAIGSVHYISPEQVSANHIDQRSDLYSVGILMYEMLTGELPFDAENPVSVALMQLQMEPPRPTEKQADIPEGLEEVILKCMAKNPDNRYGSTGELMEDIELFKQNPNIRFEYKYLSDENPTKYMDAIRSIQDEEEFDDVRAKRSHIGTLAGIVAGVLVVSFALILLLIRGGGDAVDNRDIEVPSFVGSLYSEIDEAVHQQFNIIVAQEEHQTDHVKGEIYRQNPVAGMMVKRGADIRIYVSLGNRTFDMPNFIGANYLQAQSELTKQGAQSRLHYEYSDILAQDLVLHTEPGVGEEVTADTVVKITVSLGRAIAMAQVPDLLGKSEELARALLTEAGLVPSGTAVESEAPESEVLSQDPAFGTEIEEGSVVRYTVSSGQAAEALITKEITVQLPLNPETVELVIKQGGEVVHTGTYETSRRSVRINLYGMGVQIVEIYINGVLQESAYVPFDT